MTALTWRQKVALRKAQVASALKRAGATVAAGGRRLLNTATKNGRKRNRAATNLNRQMKNLPSRFSANVGVIMANHELTAKAARTRPTVAAAPRQRGARLTPAQYRPKSGYVAKRVASGTARLSKNIEDRRTERKPIVVIGGPLRRVKR